MDKAIEGRLNQMFHDELVKAHGSDRVYVSLSMSQAINAAMRRAYEMGWDDQCDVVSACLV